jgi:hypothetical protein
MTTKETNTKVARRRSYKTNSTLAGINLVTQRPRSRAGRAYADEATSGKGPDTERRRLYYAHQKPTELHYQRHELLLREARDARAARKARPALRRAAPEKGNDYRMAGLRRATALWGRTSVPFFRA